MYVCIHTYIEKVKVLVSHLCPALCNPMSYSLPSSSVHGLLQARILEWAAIPFRGSSQPRNWTQVSCVAGKLFTVWVTMEALISQVKHFSTFICMGRCKSLDSLKSFLSYALHLPWVSIPCFSHPEPPWGSPQGVVEPWLLLDNRYSPSWVCLGLTSSYWGAGIADDWWHPCLLIWQEIFYFSKWICGIKHMNLT